MTTQKIFFSYSRADGFEFARRLAVDLKKKGFDVWIDQEDIRAGLKWDAEIEKALESADCVLYLETEKSGVSANVLDEVYYAIEQNKKVIPLIFVDSRTPFRLQRLQHIDFTQNYNTGLALLVNELEGLTTPISYQHEDTAAPIANRKPFYAKQPRVLFLTACVAILITAVVILTTKNKSKIVGDTNVANSLKDTSTNSEGMTSKPSPPVLNNMVEADISKTTTSHVKNKKRNQAKTILDRTGILPRKAGVSTSPTTENSTNNLNETLAGDWRLVSVEPKALDRRGYLWIEALDENKANIKSYMQFYYPEKNSHSELTIFNAFANCTSCVVNKEMKLKVEDIAVASRTIKTAQQDQAHGIKAGDTILNAGSNKSIRGTITLRMVDNNNVVIKIQQPLTIALSYGLMLEPFVYIFRFKRND